MNFFHELEAKYGGSNHIMIGKFLASAQWLKGLLFRKYYLFLNIHKLVHSMLVHKGRR